MRLGIVALALGIAAAVRPDVLQAGEGSRAALAPVRLGAARPAVAVAALSR